MLLQSHLFWVLLVHWLDKLICGISPFTTVFGPTAWKAFQEWFNFIVTFGFQMNCCCGWSRDLQLNGASLLKVKRNKVMLLALTHPKQTCSSIPSPFFQMLSLGPQCRSCSPATLVAEDRWAGVEQGLQQLRRLSSPQWLQSSSSGICMSHLFGGWRGGSTFILSCLQNPV